jgi:hypothetical protein
MNTDLKKKVKKKYVHKLFRKYIAMLQITARLIVIMSTLKKITCNAEVLVVGNYQDCRISVYLNILLVSLSIRMFLSED